VAELFDRDDPEPMPPTSGKGRGHTKAEHAQGNHDLGEVVAGDSDEAKRRAMAAALYRLGAEPLNKLAVEMMKLLEGHV
jgi:hypothetical protein